jgi:hypothetical protein
MGLLLNQPCLSQTQNQLNLEKILGLDQLPGMEYVPVEHSPQLDAPAQITD